MHSMAAFVRLARPRFLLGGFAGFALGAAVAAYEGAPITLARYAAGQAMVTAFHLMTHFANDYFDRDADRLGRPTEFSGGSGVLAGGALAPSVALTAALACAALGCIGVIAFALAGMPVVAAIGAAIGLGAWWYSAPPLRLAVRGWGEIDTTVVVAILVPLAGYAVFTGTVDPLALTATAPAACAMFAMMIAVEWPDRRADAAGAKRNLLVRFGSSTGARLATGAALLIVPTLLAAIGWGAPWTGVAFAVILAPVLVSFVRRLNAAGAPAVEVAARGVAVFLLTVTFEMLAYVTVLR